MENVSLREYPVGMVVLRLVREMPTLPTLRRLSFYLTTRLKLLSRAGTRLTGVNPADTDAAPMLSYPTVSPQMKA